MSTKTKKTSDKILIKVVGHKKDAKKCTWGIFRDNEPLAEEESGISVNTGRNILVVAKAAKKYADEHKLKVSNLITDVIADKNLEQLMEKVSTLNEIKADAKKTSEKCLNALIECTDAKKKEDARKAWKEALADEEAKANDVKDAQAELIKACDAWFQARISSK